ncbi:MAG TPA: glycosyltransferase family 2 protein [Candidatus Olsenella avicola]|nr:glycosyltransferase family 2 protein [Candidatus Olsenella avicola]
MDLISVVVPCYNEQETLPIFVPAISEVARSLNREHGARMELVLVDDGSSDGTLGEMRAAAQQATPFLDVRWVSFSRNFGKESAMFAGLEKARGDFVAVMDADMQDPPELLQKMYAMLLEQDIDCVATRRVTREGEPPIRSFFARLFYRIINKISNADIVDGARDYRLMTRQMADAVLSMREYNRFSKGIFGWIGFRTTWLPYVNAQRVAGETKWSFFSLLLYSIDGIVAFSTVPLSIASVVGVVFCLLALVGLVFIVVRTLLVGDPVDGWPSLVCIITLLGGIQLLCLGIIGQYLSKTYLETKRRPIYIVREEGGSDPAEVDPEG